MEKVIETQIKTLMEKNRRKKGPYQYTVPSPELYPFQWFWDSCFHAEILKHFDLPAAKAEIKSATSHTLPSGLFPHIIYWRDDYKVMNWGRERRGDVINSIWGENGMSTIVQPPLIPVTISALYSLDHDKAFLKELYPTVRTHFIQLAALRDPEDTGLLGIINPDESGEDNSPRFDAMQSLPPNHSIGENLTRRMDRIVEYKTCEFNAYTCMKEHFWVEDVSFNVIYYRGLCAMADIARELGNESDATLFDALAQQTKQAMRNDMEIEGVYYSLQGHARQPIKLHTWNIFMPLWGGILTETEAVTLIEEYLKNRDFFCAAYPVPSVALNEEAFENDFWRGPTWMVINWFVYQGLMRYGFNDIADTIKTQSLALLEKSGFREYYDPQTGDGLGAHNFTWGGLVIDMK